MKKTLFLLLLVLCIGANAQSFVKGYVFEDVNKNKKMDRAERGVTGVAVSNGIEVVLTDSKGKYTLPISEDAIIFVVKPAGYSVPINEDMLPQFYYIHKPKGSPVLEYPGVSPTGELPKLVNFPLYKNNEGDKFTSLIFGDPQVYSLEEIDYFSRGVVSELEGVENISFGLTMGDLVGDDLDLFAPLIKSVKKIGVPWHNLPGNHDMNFDSQADSLSFETFSAYFGPHTYAMNVGQVHFIVLKNILYPDPRGGKGYWGGFTESQFRFMENYVGMVPRDHLLVFAGHIPLSDEGGGTFRDEDRLRLFNLLKDHPNTLSLSAHTHMQKHVFFKEEDGWKQAKPHHHFNIGTTCGSWYTGRFDENGVPVSTMRDGTPKGYAYMHFDGNKYSIRYKAAGHSADHQMTIYAPKVVEHKSRSWPGIFVNFFMGHSDDEVLLRVDNGAWQKMNYIETYDPSYQSELFLWDFTEELIPGKRPSPARLSKHLWNSFVPTGLDPGEHTIEIKATDMFGNIYFDSKKFTIKTP
jgi:hypothetical protein